MHVALDTASILVVAFEKAYLNALVVDGVLLLVKKWLGNIDNMPMRIYHKIKEIVHLAPNSHSARYNQVQSEPQALY